MAPSASNTHSKTRSRAIVIGCLVVVLSLAVLVYRSGAVVCTPLGTTTPILQLCQPASGETGWATAINNNFDVIDRQFAGGTPFVPRSYLAGCTMSTAGGSMSLTIAACQATDSNQLQILSLPSSITKTTASWAAGTNAGGLDTGSISAFTWYHFYICNNSNATTKDAFFSLSANAPMAPTACDRYRRIGAAKTDGVRSWTAFVQDGDYFQWLAPINDINVTNPGVTAVTRTLSVPTGVNVIWDGVGSTFYSAGNGTPIVALISDLATTDTAPTGQLGTWSTVGYIGGVGSQGLSRAHVRTNNSAQVRSRLSASDTSTQLWMTTVGWYDRRGRDS